MIRRTAVLCLVLPCLSLAITQMGCGDRSSPSPVSIPSPPANIQHIVVIFEENVSFDHYFGTYPNALNLPGETPFTALTGTPAVDGLSQSLLAQNPNFTNTRNGNGASNPFRLSPLNAATADQDHSYNQEQLAFDGGAMDLFPHSVGAADSPGQGSGTAATTGLTMGYYDGNTVTALWNYAQQYAMSDRFFGTTFGPSTLGALNLVSGQTNGVVNDGNAAGNMVSDGNGGFTLTRNAAPVNDICSSTSGALIHMTGRNVGDLLNAAAITWGFFHEGFDTSVTNVNGTTGCRRSNRSMLPGKHRWTTHRS